MAGLPLKSDAFKIGSAVYRPADRVVVHDGREQRLEPRIAALLDILAAHPGTILARDRLLDDVWGDEGSDEALTQAISKLRQVLGDRSLVRTEPRKGYSLTVEPTPHSTQIAEPAPAAAKSQAAAANPARLVRVAFASGIAIGLLVAALVAALMWPKTVTEFESVTEFEPVTEFDEQGDLPASRTVRCVGDTPEDCEDMIETEE
ncbi:winged helix-turn-helix domain-containing protein [Sphingomicrobium sediminis]|uniref:Winged helix-turn-helix domain-containing protein n=1 Tax=Sphingomicrobium sediminis TaxID=2950949 RepID=A0A9X2EK99_9SPHN|nr:winged helix-turn-helix domain-containing protein [Sphingomicrobium sediminis]MCM8557164.1 winged helix-turn-helix domain-containing protein [Sphingomicrobium sediminis]